MPRQRILSVEIIADVETRDDDTEFVFRKRVVKALQINQLDIALIASILESGLPEVGNDNTINTEKPINS